MKKNSFKWLFVGVLLASSLLSCTRSVDKSSAQFVLKFPTGNSQDKLQGQATTDPIGFIVVNVRGPDMASPFVYHWDAWEECTKPCDESNMPTAPSQIEVTVPSGTDRLVQVFAVRMSMADESMEFIYGDKKTDLNVGSQSVDITLSSVGSSSGGEGRISGRYKSSKGLVTSDVILKYQPPLDGRPALEIERGEMFAGWFAMFGLVDVNFIYEIAATGEKMWGGPVNLTTLSTADSVLSIQQPTTYRDWDADFKVDETRPSGYRVVGFWDQGQASTTETVCYDSTVQDSTEEFIDDTLTDALSWPTDFTLAGGLTTCSGTEFTDLITVSTDMILNHGGHIVSSMGPFKVFTPSGQTWPGLLHTAHDTTNSSLSVDWEYLPNVTGEGAVEGATVFVNRSLTSDMHFDGFGGYDCSSLPDYGFTETYDIASTSSNATISNITETELSTTKVIVCPYRDGKYFRSALESHCLGGCDGGGSNISISAVTPTTVPDIGFADITISGSGLTEISSIDIGGVNCSVASQTDTSMICTTGAMSIGTHSMNLVTSTDSMIAADISVQAATFADYTRDHIQAEVTNGSLTTNPVTIESGGAAVNLGRYVMYQTTAGNLGILAIVDYYPAASTNDLYIDYKTFASDGTVLQSGVGTYIQGTYTFDFEADALQDIQNQQMDASNGQISAYGTGVKLYLVP